LRIALCLMINHKIAHLGSPLWELTCHMGSHSVTCHTAEVKFPPLSKPKLVLDLATRKGRKAELTCVIICAILTLWHELAAMSHIVTMEAFWARFDQTTASLPSPDQRTCVT